MNSRTEQHKLALLSCIELVLMRRGNTDYNLVVAKLDSLYNCTIRDCYEHPDYLRTILKDVYNDEYNNIIDEIKVQLDELTNVEEIRDFCQSLAS
ncbi:MAG TPA: hypothetical protein VGA92_08510 [Candidatus Nitrosotenuis sp.]|jgi:hypothetical protein